MALSVLAFFAGGCGSYADFTLPPLPKAPDLQLRIQLHPEPVLARSGEHDVLNPSVTHDGKIFYNLYSDFDGHTWHTSLATSHDGHGWQKNGRLLSPDSKTWEGDYIAANGSVLFEGANWWYWYQAGSRDRPRIGLARSRDGRHWAKAENPVLNTGPRGSWDEEGVADPYVLKLGNTFYLYYLGQDRARQQQIGVARSADGVHWTKLRGNPVLTIPWPGAGRADENGLGEPAVWESNGWYWMIYTGRDRSEWRSLLTARSADGVHWAAQTHITGNSAWDREVICDPTVWLEGDRLRLWFGGGNKARPDENLNGQIGEGEIRIVPSTEAAR